MRNNREDNSRKAAQKKDRPEGRKDSHKGNFNNHKKPSDKKFYTPKATNSYVKISDLFSANSSVDTSILLNFDELIQGVRPLNSKQLQQLPDNIKALSHQLTDQRSERRLGYMNDNIQLSSYIRYYTWWNLIRLTKLFSNLPAAVFPAKDGICLDLGSGPLTVVMALWLARPELRKLKLTWYCLDVSGNSMALGENAYLSMVARSGEEPWNIIRIKGPFGTSIKQKADFITCANMFNELDQASDMPPEFQTKKYFEQLKVYSTPEASFLLVEPGVPKAARTLSLLRTRFLDAGKNVIAPCPHAGECPMNGFKAYTGSQNKWCNFAFNTEDAPAKLSKLSEKAKLPKERATLSFIAVTGTKAEENKELLCRVASDPFRLPGNRTGFYACSKLGLTLLSVKTEKEQDKQPLTSGDLISVKIKTPDSLPTDKKSGALLIEL